MVFITTKKFLNKINAFSTKPNLSKILVFLQSLKSCISAIFQPFLELQVPKIIYNSWGSYILPQNAP